MQLVSFFQEEGYKVTIASTAEKREDFSFDAVETVNILLNHSSFDVFIKEMQPEMVLFDRFMSEEQFGWRLTENTPNALKILDTEDLHSLRKSRELAFKNNSIWTSEMWKAHEMTQREVASILRCDISLMISDFEIKLLSQVIPNAEELLLHLPFMVATPDDNAIADKPKFENRNDFLFIGFGGHAPNVDAILYLKKEIWPIIQSKLPKVKLNIYGANFPQKITQLHNTKEGFIVHGWAKNAHEVISNARILLAPIRFGAGQKGKLLDAMLCGTPSITTTIGAEGMQNDLEWNGQILDDPKAFAYAAIEAYMNQETWMKYQENGQQILIQNFNKNQLEKRLRFKLNQIRNNLDSHRDTNFIGKLLQHQTMASSKYMSKWIEAKNKY
ncbi:glycosyltransferase family 4 protein [Aurantibacter crassamenti]|nr:glycosyltransferase family 4 protein [Aurantibacter crassamenti]